MRRFLAFTALLFAWAAEGAGGIDVLCIYYPEWHVYPEGEAIFGKGRTEWDYVDSAKPRFPGHEQPLKLLDGHPDDANPADVAKEIDYAADAGIDCLVYDWYWADGHPIQHEALERGFLKAPNRRRLKFALMWANHNRSDVFRTAPGHCNDRFWWTLKYDRTEFLAAIDYCISHYFNQPEYYRKDGKVFLSIYSARELVNGLGGPKRAKDVFVEAQVKMKAAGLPELHLSAMIRDARGAQAMAAAGFDSVSAYNITPYDFDDSQVKEETGETRQLFTHEEFAALHETFNAKIAAGSPVPYIPVVSRGWDPSPRCRLDEPFPWRKLWYPYLGIIKDLSPDCFAKSVAFAKRQAENDPKKPGAILINAWNEYTEGSYLMPDEKNGDAYLKALQRALGCVVPPHASDEGCRLKKLGTYDMFIGEANPIVFKGRLLMMEYIRHMGPELRYRFNTTGKGYFRFRDLKDLKTFTPSFGVGLHMGNAFVAGDRVVVTAVEKWGGSRIFQMESEDLEHWTEPRVILENPRWGVYNTTMCRAGDRYVLGFELGCPAELVGVPYTMFFAESRDLTNWSVVEGARMGADIYTGAPMLRHFGDWFYFFHLEGSYDKGFETRVMRSRDLFDWELSPKVVLGYDPWDKMIHPQATFTDEERATIAAAVDINASDFDMCEWQGKLIGFYSWGDQRGHEFSALATADCSEREFCEGFFR